MVGLAVDLSMMYLIQTRLSSAVDAASLAAARGLSRGGDPTAQASTAQTTANNYVEKNFPGGTYQISGSWDHSATTTGNLWSNTTVNSSTANVRIVTTNASVVVPLFFMRYVGPTTRNITATAQVTRRDTNVMMVLDRSGSLANSGSCTPMKASASAFVDQFALGVDNVGLVTFAAASNVDVAASTSFTSVKTTINQITCVGGTNSSQGLWQGYTELVRLNQPNALNVILFFTDGNPSHATLTNNISGSSACTNKASRVGVIGVNGNVSAVTGLYEWLSTSVTSTSVMLVQNAANCGYITNPPYPANDVVSVPSTDYYGNSVNVPNSYTGYSSLAANFAITPANMDILSTNVTISAANRIRSGANTGSGSVAGVYIYSLGLGNYSSPPDAPFLKDVANDLYAANYTATQRAGQYVAIPTAADINQAFQSVASAILRLSR